MVRQSGLTSLAAGASVIAGLLLDVSIAAKFGAGRSTDAFFVAARIPLGMVAIVMVAANQALVPSFSASLARRGETATWRLVSTVLTVAALCGVVLVGVVWLLARPLVRITAPGISASEASLSASLVPVVFGLVPLVSVSEVLRALLNARYAFVAPAAMNVLLNGVAATIILVLSHGNIHVVAWAYLAGAGAQVTFMTLMALRRGLRFRPSLRVRDSEVTAVGRLMVRPFIAAGLNPVARVGEQLVISFLPTGSITISNYGYRLISAIGGTVFFRSVVVALVPRLTEATTRGEHQQVERVTRLGVRIMLAISVPLTAFMAVLATPAALVIFQRGSFHRDSAALLGVVLAVYSASLVGSAVQRALLAPFFARLDTRTPLRNTFYGVVANLALLPLCILAFDRHSDRAVIGVALAYSLAQYVNVAHAMHRLRQEFGHPLAGMTALLVRLVAASSLAAGVMLALAFALRVYDPIGRNELLLRLVVVALAGVAVLVLALAGLARQELLDTVRAMRGARRGQGRRGAALAGPEPPEPSPVADVPPPDLGVAAGADADAADDRPRAVAP